MTEEELKLELQCYKTAFNDKLDIDNLKLEDIAEFMTLYLEIKDREIVTENFYPEKIRKSRIFPTFPICQALRSFFTFHLP